MKEASSDNLGRSKFQTNKAVVLKMIVKLEYFANDSYNEISFSQMYRAD